MEMVPPVKFCRSLPAAFALLLPAAQPLAADTGAAHDLTVTVTGLHSTKGQLIACLWQDKQGFPSCEKSRSALRKIVPVTGETMQLTLPLDAAGNHAVTVIHDEDGNGKMKRNFIGMPTEGVGISNNPGGMPGYDKSLAPLAPGGEITIRIKYLFG